MGNYLCNGTNEKVLVLQTGKLRGEYIELGESSLNINNLKVIHRWLPSDFEAKYEALDFVTKFNLHSCDFINIYNDNNHLINIKSFLDTQFQSPDSILKNVNIIVSCGSSSLQAFKLTRGGPEVLLPIINPKENDDTNLTFEKLNFFGGGSDSSEIASSVLNYLNENAFRICSVTGNTVKTNIIIVNQLGYSILGFNPRDGSSPPIPNEDQKVVSIKDPPTSVEFKDNRKKTLLINTLQTIMVNSIKSNNLYLVARQCKVMVRGNEEELSGQWATQTNSIMNEARLEITNKQRAQITTVIDLGGGSGTVYRQNHKNEFVKDDMVAEFMKEDSVKPNNFVGKLDEFVTTFNQEFRKL